ncbi:MAG: hypothetical protein KA354_21215 [Phycisphaerae bacterium]|nr:hypothetical protein [Phycisphaerae bacterium]
MVWLLVNVDTEEEGLWGSTFPTSDWRLEHLAELPRLQALFDRYGVRPSYQVTSPVVQDDRASGLLQDYLDGGRCDIGAHLHTWSTQPIALPADIARSMPCHLPVELVRRQLLTLTEQIRSRFGMQPVTYRSGRYGSSAEHTALLTGLGYRVETSVCPLVDHTRDGGPDYYDAPFEPYWLGGDSMLVGQPNGLLLSVPISAGFNRRCFESARRLHRLLSRPPLSKFRTIGILYRLGLLRLIRLNPEMTSLGDMIALCDTLARRRTPVYHLTFHSSDIGVGGTPYVPTIEARDAFLDRLDGILEHLVNYLGAQPVTAREYYDLFRESAACKELAAGDDFTARDGGHDSPVEESRRFRPSPTAV